MEKVVLAGTIPGEARVMLRERLQNRFIVEDACSLEDALAVKDTTYMVTRGLKFPQPVIEDLPASMRLLHRWGVGFDSIDIEAAGKRGIRVAVCTGGNAQPVAELTLTLIMAAYRRLPALLARAREGRKDKEDIIAGSYLLQGKTVGLVGFGNIGSKVAKMVQGFGAKVQYYDAFRMKPETEQKLGVQYVELEQLLRTSDIISLHVPLFDSTAHMIDKKAFELMKPTALLVNTARGPIVDTQALLDAVEEGKILGAALDTIEGEPLAPDHPIFASDRVLLTPHGGGNTCDNLGNMVQIIADNIIAMDEGTGPEAKYIVNAQYLA